VWGVGSEGDYPFCNAMRRGTPTTTATTRTCVSLPTMTERSGRKRRQVTSSRGDPIGTAPAAPAWWGGGERRGVSSIYSECERERDVVVRYGCFFAYRRRRPPRVSRSGRRHWSIDVWGTARSKESLPSPTRTVRRPGPYGAPMTENGGAAGRGRRKEGTCQPFLAKRPHRGVPVIPHNMFHISPHKSGRRASAESGRVLFVRRLQNKVPRMFPVGAETTSALAQVVVSKRT
jgi:hypothetical protein